MGGGLARHATTRGVKMILHRIASACLVTVLFCHYRGAAQNDNCTGGTIDDVGKGRCDAENNNPSCGYDGGDCCLCTCSGGNCAVNVNDCLDPDAGSVIFDCEPPPPVARPCWAEDQREWVVADSAQAQALAEAVNCSGGTFTVEWRGSVVLDRAIYVADGTVLNVTGVDSSAIMDGNLSTRLFLVVNASLHVSGLRITHGSSIVGGAIAASRSVLTFTSTTFASNTAAHGGGLHAIDESTVEFVGVGFSDNAARIDGGAVYLSGGSVMSCGGIATFLDNSAGGVGGAILAETGSTVSWNGNASFLGNSAWGGGGAILVDIGSTVFWSGNTWFLGNSAGAGGGAISADSGSPVSWSGKTVFAGNRAGIYGGALYLLHGSSASWSAATAFFNNSAEWSGGALTAQAGSSAVWVATTLFERNNAGYYGGAMYVLDDAAVSWSGETSFLENIAGLEGGAVTVEKLSSVVWSGATTVSGNQAGDGGALSVFNKSTVSWDGTSKFLNNSAHDCGGAIFVVEASSVSWTGETRIVGNSAGNGGGLYARDYSIIDGSGNTTFDGNIVLQNGDGYGGAIELYLSIATWSGHALFARNRASAGGAISGQLSIISWSGQTAFVGNDASNNGGALFLDRATVSWDGTSAFLNNSSSDTGGAIFVAYASTVSWSGETVMAHNSALGDEATAGGTLFVLRSNITWSGKTSFVNSSAGLLGGAMSVYESNVSWGGHTEFFDCSAKIGGAVCIMDGSHVEMGGRTDFTSNEALNDGGAVGSFALDAKNNPQVSKLVINGYGVFADNTCGANGGGIAVFAGLSLAIEVTADVTFVGNSAAIAGGAIFVSGVGVGPAFFGVSFVNNSAQVGGGIYATGSGNLKDTISDVVAPNPTTFDGCRFIGNRAIATGGAIESVAGTDTITNGLFLENTAGVGGAVRLAGIAFLDNCSFVSNSADEGQGAALSNAGFMSKMDNISFVGNVFRCQPGTFLDYNASGDYYEAVCDGCTIPCQGCFFEEPTLVPICTEVMDHSISSGGSTTVETLSIERGYWRATASSREILACYNANACRGGLTEIAGNQYCTEGYEGPYCSICSGGYTASMGYVCTKCPDVNIGGIFLVVVLAFAALIFAFGVVKHLLSKEAEGSRRGVVGRLTRYIPWQSLKIAVVVWQILTQFTSVANVVYPGVYQKFLDGVEFFNFDLSWILSVGCFVDTDFHDRLLITTIAPVIVVALLATTYAVSAQRNRESDEALQNVRVKHVSAVLVLTYLVYSTVSSTVFRSFACEVLDDGKNYLRADYRIECDSVKHRSLQIYAGFMIVLYAVGIPSLYTYLLFKDRDMLPSEGRSDHQREAEVRFRSTAQLWKPYKPSVFYYEVIECIRRISLAGVVVFIYPNTAAQIAVTLLIAVGFMIVSEGLAPYVSTWDSWINRVGHVVVFVSMYVALLLKVDVSDERADSQKVFEAVLVAVHALMILAVVAETTVLACSLRREEQEDQSPWFRKNGRFVSKGSAAPASSTTGDTFIS